MNKWIGIARLTKDIELKYSTSGTAYMQNGIAVDRKGKEKATDFFNVSAFGKTAEAMEKYLRKGSKIAIEGHLQADSYTDKTGQKKTSVSIIIDSWEFAEAKGEEKKDSPAASEWLNIPEGLTEELPFS